MTHERINSHQSVEFTQRSFGKRSVPVGALSHTVDHVHWCWVLISQLAETIINI